MKSIDFVVYYSSELEIMKFILVGLLNLLHNYIENAASFSNPDT